jgi:cation diffusion facilitator CzcD-associated flavoprotein CzcO
MNTASGGPELGAGGGTTVPDVDVLVIGAGINGIHQLFRAVGEGFSAQLWEAGGGVGGVWYWNRYPEARFDSESYTYGYLFSRDLFDDWYWQEHFAGQPEVERYLNHVVDRFGLRPCIRLGAKVVSAVWDEGSGTWTVRSGDGATIRAHFIVAATGGLSVPYLPDVPGREDFRGMSSHTGLWPARPVDFKGKRVAVVGTGPSGIQIIPAVAGEVESLTVYQRTPNWCTPLNNRPITAEEQETLRAEFESIRQVLETSPSGFLHTPHDRNSYEDSKAQRWAHYEKMWNSPGFSKLSTNYRDMTTNKEVNAEFCQFLAEKIRSIVNDPVTADKLIPKDHLYGAKRPPFMSGYYETFNNPKVSLVDLKETPMLRVTETGIETSEGLREFDIIVWATGFDFGTGALTRMGIRGRGGVRVEEYWAEGPRTYLGFMCHRMPNFFFPGGPHGAGGGNFPRYGSDQVNFVTDTLIFMRDHGYWTIDAPLAAEEVWMTMVNTLASKTMFSRDHSHYYGANIPGKPRVYYLNPGGRAKLHEMLDEMIETDYRGFVARRDDLPGWGPKELQEKGA